MMRADERRIPRALEGWIACLAPSLVLLGCATHPAAPTRAAPWEQRMSDLQRATAWQLDGRTAVSVGEQGWQASLDWQQQGDSSVVHLAGPFGAGAVVVTLTPAGLSVNGAPPGAGEAALDERLGFEPPLAALRFWLLGVPAPDAPFELTRNSDGRALTLTQSGWRIEYERYLPVAGDWLPALVRLERDAVHVRIAVDRWEAPK